MKEELKFEVILSEDDFNSLYELAQTRDDLRHLLVPLEGAELKVSYKPVSYTHLTLPTSDLV